MAHRVLTTAALDAVDGARRRLFGQLPRAFCRTGNKQLMAPLRGPAIASWYPEDIKPHVRRHFPSMYPDELTERRAAKLALMKRFGKGPPKKGAGKRSKKR
ncbi:unnamed protein product [Phaeothamnion confervicola]